MLYCRRLLFKFSYFTQGLEGTQFSFLISLSQSLYSVPSSGLQGQVVYNCFSLNGKVQMRG